MSEKKSFETKEYTHPLARGVFRHPEAHRKFVESCDKHHFQVEGPLPGKLDLSSKVSLCENQGACGSCWDFALTKAFRSAWMLFGKDPGRLAFNFLLNNCGGVQEYGCDGGDFDAGQSFLTKTPWLESQDPYTQRDGARCMNLPGACDVAKSFKVVGPGNRPPTFQELAAAMNGNGGRCLVVDVAVVNGWDQYSSGIYNGDGRGINHMINMVGYDMQTSVDKDGNALFNAEGQPVNGDGYLIVMNNWGESWGTKAGNNHGGYMFSRWGKNQLAETAMFFDVGTVPTPVPPNPPAPPTPPTPSSSLPFWAWLLMGIAIPIVGYLVIEGVLHLEEKKVPQ